MITARLEGQTSIKTCIKCQYETSSVDSMLNHLNTHRLNELEMFMKSKPIDRYGGIKP